MLNSSGFTLSKGWNSSLFYLTTWNSSGVCINKATEREGQVGQFSPGPYCLKGGGPPFEHLSLGLTDSLRSPVHESLKILQGCASVCWNSSGVSIISSRSSGVHISFKIFGILQGYAP